MNDDSRFARLEMPTIGIGLGLGLSGSGNGFAPPPGHVFLIDTDGAYLLDSDGAYLVEAI